MTFETKNQLSQPEHCSKFDHCSATLCPLDPMREQRLIHRDDPVCFFLLEVGKAGAKERISMGHSISMYELANKTYLEITSMTCPINKALKRAKHTPSRMRSLINQAN